MEDDDKSYYPQESSREVIFSIEEIEENKIVIKDQSVSFNSLRIVENPEEILRKLLPFLRKVKREVIIFDHQDKKRILLYNDDLSYKSLR